MSKNKVQCLNLASHLWPTFIIVIFVITVWIHCSQHHGQVFKTSFKFFIAKIFLIPTIYEQWQWGCWKYPTTFKYALWIWSLQKFISSIFIFHLWSDLSCYHFKKKHSSYVFIFLYWILFTIGWDYCLQLWKGENNVCHVDFYFEMAPSSCKYLTMHNFKNPNIRRNSPYP